MKITRYAVGMMICGLGLLFLWLVYASLIYASFYFNWSGNISFFIFFMLGLVLLGPTGVWCLRVFEDLFFDRDVRDKVVYSTTERGESPL